MKPNAVINYNIIDIRMVDKYYNMMIGFIIECLRKGCKWYKKAFLYIVDMCMLLNTYILYDKAQAGVRSQPSLT